MEIIALERRVEKVRAVGVFVNKTRGEVAPKNSGVGAKRQRNGQKKQGCDEQPGHGGIVPNVSRSDKPGFSNAMRTETLTEQKEASKKKEMKPFA